MQQTKHPAKFSKQSFTPPDLVNKPIKQAVCDDFVWSENREWLTSHRVFHSIRFKVNKVGIQWYPIFFALHLGLIGKQPLFFSPSPICAPARPCCLPWGGSRLRHDARNRTAPRPSTPWGDTQKRAFPHRTARMVSRYGDLRDRSMGKCPELIRHSPWLRYACRHRRRPKARSGGNISCICADSARECHRWPPRRAGNCSKGRE